VKTIPSAIQAKLTAGCSTMCYAWKIVRTDGEVLGFTDHDTTLTIDGLVCSAAAGFDATVIAASLGYTSSDVTATGVIESDDITESDILSGLYDDAEVTLFWVDWSNPSDYVVMLTGTVGQLSVNGVEVQVEIKSLLDKLNRNVGRMYRRTCDAQFCDVRCGLNEASYTEGGTVTTVLANDVFMVGGLNAVSGTYTYGLLTFAASASQPGAKCPVRMNTLDGLTLLELWSPMAVAPVVGDAFAIVSGCPRTLKACKAFGNVVNFRGFPQIPGNDVLTQIPTQGDIGNTGGSLVVY
jgi:uncharacterized phage protein (TIGR02218 family)